MRGIFSTSPTFFCYTNPPVKNFFALLFLVCTLNVSFSAFARADEVIHGVESVTTNIDSPSQKVTITSYFAKTREQIAKLKTKISGRLRSSAKPYIIIFNEKSLSQENALAIEQIIASQQVERANLDLPIELTVLAPATGRFARVRNYWREKKSLLTMTLVTSAATGGATTTALLCGDTVSDSTAVALGALWGTISGGYVFNNERMQNWIRGTTAIEDRIVSALRITNSTILNHLKVTGEWTKYFLHVAGWNAFGAMAMATLENDWRVTASTVLATSAAELFAAAPFGLAIASDTERAKARHPEMANNIQLASTFSLMVVEVSSEVLSVLALTGAHYEASIGFVAVTAGGAIYYSKTFLQDFLLRRQARAAEAEACELLLTKTEN